MTTNTEKFTVPTEMPPEAPADLQGKREGIVAGLEAEAKTATGTMQQVLRVMAQVVHNCRPDAQMDSNLDNSMRTAFQRLEKEGVTAPWPTVLVSAIEWMQAYITARGFPLKDEAVAASPVAQPAQAGAPAVQGAAVRDVFESASSKMSLTGEAAPASPGGSAEGGLKNWQLNPSLGKVRG